MVQPESREPVPSPYTVEGEIHMLGEFASGLRRARGWRRTVACFLLLAVLVGVVAVAVAAEVSG